MLVIGGIIFLLYMRRRNKVDRQRRGTTLEEDLKRAEEPENRP